MLSIVLAAGGQGGTGASRSLYVMSPEVLHAWVNLKACILITVTVSCQTCTKFCTKPILMWQNLGVFCMNISSLLLYSHCCTCRSIGTMMHIKSVCSALFLQHNSYYQCAISMTTWKKNNKKQVTGMCITHLSAMIMWPALKNVLQPPSFSKSVKTPCMVVFIS